MGRRGPLLSIAISIALSLLLPIAGPVAGVRGQDMGGSEQGGSETLDARGLLKKGLETEKTSVEEACLVYLKLLERFPKDDLAPRARLCLGLCLGKLGRTEDARARLREAHAAAKNDPAVQREAEEALIKLPPPPEPKGDKAPEPKAPEPKAPAPTAPEKATPPPAPRPPETGPRADLMAEIEKLEQEKRDLVKKAQDLEDAGKTGDAYATRALADKKANEIDAKKKELRAMPANGKRAPAPEKKPETARKTDDAPHAGPDPRLKLMLAKKTELERSAADWERKATEAGTQNRPADAATYAAQAASARKDAAEIGRKLQALQQTAPSAASDAYAKREAELQDQLKTARAAAADADKSGDQAAIKKAHDDVAAKEKALRDLEAERETAMEKGQLEKLAEQMKKRGDSPLVIDERLALARKEFDLRRAHRKEMRELRRELKAKNVADDEVAATISKREQENRAAIDKLREEGEAQIAAKARGEMEKDLEKKAADLKAQGMPQAEIDAKVAALRKELEAKLPGKRASGIEGDRKPDNTVGSANVAEPDDKKHPRKALLEENARLKKRIEELEREVAALKGQSQQNSAPANAPPGPATAPALTAPR
jgi:hypothetical protein